MADRPDPRSGLDDEGRWTPAFEGQRPPLRPGHEHRFEVGNDVAVRHGAESTIRLTVRAGELVDGLRDLVIAYRPSDEPMLTLLAVTIARVEAAAAALEAAKDPDQLQRLESNLRGWIRLARQLLGDMGMTPKARLAMGLDVAMTKRALNVTDLAAAAAELDDGGRGEPS